MYRWHSERALMLRRWRQELAIHAGYPTEALAPPSLAPDIDCHCAKGIGSMRWAKPLDCGRARCGICHWEKFFRSKNRAGKRRAAIRFELEAE